MTMEERVDRLEARLGSQDALVRELRDAVTVTAELEARQSRALRDHTAWLEEHDLAMKAHDASMKAHDLAMLEFRENGKILDRRIADLVSAFGEFIRRSENR